MTQKERMEQGLIYDPMDKDLMKEQAIFRDKISELNSYDYLDIDKKVMFLKENFAECGENCFLELPVYANFGGHHVHLGNNVYANFNLTLVDDGHIYIGDKVMIGPNVTIVTAAHPIVPELRERGLQFNREVHINENVWIGANVVILPGVTIGKNSVIGAGSIVTKDIPENVVAVGNPCKVLREICEKDKKQFYKNCMIDWENLK